MACPKCGSEDVDADAECPHCRAAAILCRECGAELQPSANFCSQCGSPLGRQNSMPPPPQQGSVWVPPALHVIASQVAHAGERRQVTVLFADLRGSLGLMVGADPEEGQALLDAVVATMVDAVHRYEGAVNQVMGDGIMALFGAPIAREDHALRAACAALAMQEAVRGLRDPVWEARNARPQIRVGLNSGEVAIRTVRNDMSMDYRAVGPTVHIASRMEQLAPPGGVCLTQTTFELGQGLLRTRPLGPRKVKGVPEPIEVHELTGISVRTRFQANALRGLSPLAGREDVLAQLEAALALAIEGKSQVAVLRGEPGVGKSRLSYEILQRAPHDVRVLEAASQSYLSARPHGLLASMVQARFAIGDDDDPSQVRAKAEQCLSEHDGALRAQLHVALELLDIPSQDPGWKRLDPVQKRRAIEDLLRALLQQWCAQGPTIVLCEDLHWCDPDSAAFVASLVEDPPGPQTLLLLTHRPDFTPTWCSRDNLRSCEVTALNPRASESLLVSLLGDTETLAPLRTWLALRTDGNPFFIEESVRTLLENGLLEGRLRTPRSDRLGTDVPANIDALLSARVDRLPEPAREVLQAAAVLGDHGSVETLRAVTGLPADEFARRFEMLTRAELLYEAVALAPSESRLPPLAASIRFKHALIQEVVYKHMLRPHRRAVHTRIVAVIETQHRARLAEHVEQLAEHAYRAELWEKCAEYQKAACVRAASRSANALALAHLERGLKALSFWPDGPVLARAAVDLRLTALAPLLPMGAHERVIELLREAEQYATQLQDKGRLARVSSQLSAELWCTARYDQARQSAEQTLQLAKELGGDQFALESAGRYNIVMVQHAQAEFEAARAGVTDLLQVFSGKAALQRLGWAGYPSVFIRTFAISISVMTGSFADAMRAFEEGKALAEQVGNAFSRTMILEQHGMCLLVRGEYAEATDWLRQAFEICKHEEVHTMYLPIASHLGLAMLGLGALDEARQLIESAAREQLDRAGHYAIGYMRIAQSELQRRLGQLEEACATAEFAVNDTQRCGERGFHVRALVQLACVLADTPGERDRALSTYIEAETRATQLGMPPWAALARQGAGRLYAAAGDKVEAAQAYAAASEIWHRLDTPARILEVSRLSDELARSG